MSRPRVTVIDGTKQEFNGERFYLCGFYYQHKGKRLHRAVWEYYYGPVPKGYHVHHIDGDRANNNIENLACIPASEHETEHMSTPERLKYGKMHIERIRPKASEWHRSEQGRAWHSRLGKESYEKRKVNTYTCTECGREFQTKHVYAKGANHFCCNTCKCRWGRHHSTKG